MFHNWLECSANETSAHKDIKRACCASHPGGNQVDGSPLVAHGVGRRLGSEHLWFWTTFALGYLVLALSQSQQTH